MTDFPHPSRPGYYGLTFPSELRERLNLLVAAMIPGGEGYPSAAEAQVVRFLEEHASEEDLVALREVSSLPVASADAAVAYLGDLERSAPALFAWWREFVYFGYYASHRVLAVLVDRGYDYHGAPQPLGYPLPITSAAPSVARGSYVPTDKVTRAGS